MYLLIACVASVPYRVIARKLEREQENGRRDRGRGKEDTDIAILKLIKEQLTWGWGLIML